MNPTCDNSTQLQRPAVLLAVTSNVQLLTQYAQNLFQASFSAANGSAACFWRKSSVYLQIFLPHFARNSAKIHIFAIDRNA